jgi:hypothetical protein
MNEFIEIPANKYSLAKRKLLYGVGINDSNYLTNTTDDSGKAHMCPYYAVWSKMLTRCYSTAFQKKHPTYINCTLHAEWLTFSNFKNWMKHKIGKVNN